MLSYYSIFYLISLVLKDLYVYLVRPLIDNDFMSADAMLGFRRQAIYVWQNNIDVLREILAIAYASYPMQLILSVFGLVCIGRIKTLSEFLQLFMLTTVVTIAISAEFPASNPVFHSSLYTANAVSAWSDFYPLRAHTMNILDIDDR